MTMNKRKLQREAQLDQQLDLAAESNKPPNATPYFATQAAMAGAIPLAIAVLVRVMNPLDYFLLLVPGFAVTVAALIFAYSRCGEKLGASIATSRRSIILASLSRTKDANQQNHELVAEAHRQGNRLSVAYNNALFFFAFVVSSFYFFRTLSESLNFIISLATAAGVVVLLSTGSK